MKIQKVIIPAGSYYIGDPALILPEDIWGKFHSDRNLVLQHNGYKFICVPLDGDGLQRDSDLFKYPIDSGSIAIIPVELFEEGNRPTNQDLFRRKTSSKPMLFRYLPYEFMSVGNIFFDLSAGEDIDYEYESEVEGHSYWKEWADDGEGGE